MTKQGAIAKYCRECSGDSPKEVTICHLNECPLWPFRLGHGMNSGKGKERMSLAAKRYKEDVSEGLIYADDPEAYREAFYGKRAATPTGITKKGHKD